MFLTGVGILSVCEPVRTAIKRSSIRGRDGRPRGSVPASARTRSGTRSAGRRRSNSEARGGVRSVTPSSRTRSLSKRSAVPVSAGSPTRTGYGRSVVWKASERRDGPVNGAKPRSPQTATAPRNTAPSCASDGPTAPSGVNAHRGTCVSTSTGSHRRGTSKCLRSKGVSVRSAERTNGLGRTTALTWTTTTRPGVYGASCAHIATTASVSSGTTRSASVPPLSTSNGSR